MKYANTLVIDGKERVVVVLPLDVVPGFDPENPTQDNTYGVPDDVEVGWIKVNGKFVPPSPVVEVIVPRQVTMGQAQLALFDKGYLPAVEAALAAMTGTEGDRARLEWKTRQSVERASPLVATMGSILGLTSAQLDELFIYAKTL